MQLKDLQNGTKKNMPEAGQEKGYRINETEWEPAANLSALSQNDFKLFERIAEKVAFLEAKEPQVIRLSYPKCCSEEFMDERYEPLEYLQFNALCVKDLPEGYLKVRPRRNLYTKCAQPTCPFRYCPFIVAAYIKYLKELHPERLEVERAKAPKDPEGAAVKVNLARLHLTPEVIESSIKTIRDGRFHMTEMDVYDRYVCTYFSGTDNGSNLATIRISAETLVAGTDENGQFTLQNGKKVPTGLSALIAVTILMKTGRLDAYRNGEGLEDMSMVNGDSGSAKYLKKRELV